MGRRKDSKASTQPHDIETDDVDDEEQFLNLDDVLEGHSSFLHMQLVAMLSAVSTCSGAWDVA